MPKKRNPELAPDWYKEVPEAVPSIVEEAIADFLYPQPKRYQFFVYNSRHGKSYASMPNYFIDHDGNIYQHFVDVGTAAHEAYESFASFSDVWQDIMQSFNERFFDSYPHLRDYLNEPFPEAPDESTPYEGRWKHTSQEKEWIPSLIYSYDLVIPEDVVEAEEIDGAAVITHLDKVMGTDIALIHRP